MKESQAIKKMRGYWRQVTVWVTVDSEYIEEFNSTKAAEEYIKNEGLSECASLLYLAEAYELHPYDHSEQERIDYDTADEFKEVCELLDIDIKYDDTGIQRRYVHYNPRENKVVGIGHSEADAYDTCPDQCIVVCGVQHKDSSDWAIGEKFSIALKKYFKNQLVPFKQ